MFAKHFMSMNPAFTKLVDHLLSLDKSKYNYNFTYDSHHDFLRFSFRTDKGKYNDTLYNKVTDDRVDFLIKMIDNF